MPWLPDRKIREEDIPALKARGDVHRLICLLGHGNDSVRSRAAEALGASDPSVAGLLVAALGSHDSRARLGAVEALGLLKNPVAVPALEGRIRHDRSIDMRWACLLALGEIADPAAAPCCEQALMDANRYVRYAAALALKNLCWEPPDDGWRTYYAVAMEDWESVRALGEAATGPLREMLRDDDPQVRIRIIDLLSRTGDPEAAEGCACALKDRRDTVRYQGLLSAIRCGLSAERLPLLLARRERTGPDPAAAAILNFLFPGIGYNYIGKWWGFLVFMSFMTLIVLAQLQMGPFLPYLFVYPATALVAVQTYYEARNMADTWEDG